jgi:hypothetical protein
MLTEAMIGAIAEAIIGYALEQFGVGDHIRSALRREPTKLALASSYAATGSLPARSWLQLGQIVLAAKAPGMSKASRRSRRWPVTS